MLLPPSAFFTARHLSLCTLPSLVYVCCGLSRYRLAVPSRSMTMKSLFGNGSLKGAWIIGAVLPVEAFSTAITLGFCASRVSRL
ncbi:hypothetical protein SAMN05421684_0607 [Asanoa ishikariensis]|uniref:Uncharacterized protein n=1 Tax=Asanoa ishikariensis TaxID=137265 RepID=A0A1H3L8C1_9ACTN|nr:hypothetical protein SAMN05421684_0607 [Asanoa ishikariensis]